MERFSVISTLFPQLTLEKEWPRITHLWSARQTDDGGSDMVSNQIRSTAYSILLRKPHAELRDESQEPHEVRLQCYDEFVRTRLPHLLSPLTKPLADHAQCCKDLKLLESKLALEIFQASSSLVPALELLSNRHYFPGVNIAKLIGLLLKSTTFVWIQPDPVQHPLLLKCPTANRGFHHAQLERPNRDLGIFSEGRGLSSIVSIDLFQSSRNRFITLTDWVYRYESLPGYIRDSS